MTCANDKAIYTIYPEHAAGSGFTFFLSGNSRVVGRGSGITVTEHGFRVSSPGVYSFSGRILSTADASNANIAIEDENGNVIAAGVYANNMNPTAQQKYNAFIIPEFLFNITDTSKEYRVYGAFFDTVQGQTYYTIKEI